MKIDQILSKTDHRPWPLPLGIWRFFQEWNDVLFLHWKVDLELLQTYLPKDLEIDTFEGSAFVSLVAFTMENVRPRNLPAFGPISDFHEINIRTYVKYKGRSGVYFLSIEGGKRLSCVIARSISGLPYVFSKMDRSGTKYSSFDPKLGNSFRTNYKVGSDIQEKTAQDEWLTERYALFQDVNDKLVSFDIHHLEWPIQNVEVNDLEFQYPDFQRLLVGEPQIAHYSHGVRVLAWSKVYLEGR